MASITTEAYAQQTMTNRYFRVFLVALENIIGTDKMAKVLQTANLTQYVKNFPPSNDERENSKILYFTQINQALFDIYGKRGARTILEAVGRARASVAIQEYGAIANAVRIMLGLLPLKMKARIVLDNVVRNSREQAGTKSNSAKRKMRFTTMNRLVRIVLVDMMIHPSAIRPSVLFRRCCVYSWVMCHSKSKKQNASRWAVTNVDSASL
jgi:hypothetical protein